MVEGPGCKVKGEKMKPRLKGKVVKRVSGNAVERENKAKKKNPDAVNGFFEFIGRKLDDVQTLGKELFMYFGDKCFRVHFLMAGSYRVNDQVLDHDPSNNSETESMLLEIGDDKVAFYKSAVHIRDSAECREKFNRLQTLDICSSVFNHKRAVETFMEHGERQVCDVLLDQVVLPGVGNIIKNEALFDSGIRPATKVKELNEPLISHLIKMTRDFSMIFYKCRKTGESLRKYMKVYNRGTCGQCKGKITRTRSGDDSARMTYYCPRCQVNNPKITRTLPSKNSLLGWVTSGGEASNNPAWTCSLCTLINTGSAVACAACLSTKPVRSPKAIQVPILKQVEPNIENVTNATSRSTTHSLTGKRKHDALPPLPAKKLRSDEKSFEFGNQVNLPLSGNVKTPQEIVLRSSPRLQKRKSSFLGAGVSESSNEDSTPPNKKRALSVDLSTAFPQKTMIPPSTFSKSVTQQRRGSQQASVPSSQGPTAKASVPSSQGPTAKASVPSSQGPKAKAGSKIPVCPTHQKKCFLREVRKKGPNLGRLFFSCSLPRGKQCFIFSWADEDFPVCEGHGKKCVLRTVLKEGANNGRKFFACSVDRKKQCKFFQWADEYNED